MASSWIAAAGVLLVGGIVLSRILLRRRRHVWATFARKHGFHYREREGTPAVEGHLDGRRLHLQVLERGSNDGELGFADIRMSLTLHEAPRALRVQRAHGAIGAARKALESDVLDTGDARFDDEMLVQGPPAAARDYLRPARRDVILALLEVADAGEVGIDDGALYVEDRSMVSDAGQLQAMLTRLRNAAAQLDAVGAEL